MMQLDSVLALQDTQARNVRNAKWDSMGSLLAKIANAIWLDPSIQFVMNLVFALAKQESVEIGAPDACPTCSAFQIVKVLKNILHFGFVKQQYPKCEPIRASKKAIFLA